MDDGDAVPAPRDRRPIRPPPAREIMDEAKNQTRRMMLEAGQVVILHPDGPAGGFPLVVPVDRVASGEHWFLGSIEPIGRGETLIVELPVQNDARYATRAEVVACSPSTFALKLETEWERVQQRAFVRISAHGLLVRVVRLSSHSTDDDGAPGDDVHELIDVSAGGIRFAADDGFDVDEEVICHFELPGSLCFVLPARIVRSPDAAPTPTDKPSVAVEFAGLDETNRSQLLRWVYREQVRRHRESARAEEKAQKLAERRGDSRR